MKQEFNRGGPAERRPFLSSDCDDLGSAEKWRRDIIREVSKSVAEIQNAGLGEHKIRDLNDQINKLIREKRHWQHRIQEMGGPNYNGMEPKTYDVDGRELPGGGGYKYFGAAKELPGVRELFQAEAPEKPRRTRSQMYKGITPDYYGYRDEDDGSLVIAERKAEEMLIEAEVQMRRDRKRQRVSDHLKSGTEDVLDSDSEEEESVFGSALEKSALTNETLKAHVPVPSQDEIKNAILDYRKQQLIAQYTQ
eukprot:CAMPEP_0185775644 /NCGR_PEP_ID=MMETSP1174-20130828/82781_1 /TAXON_ID=35687 /ORGANISM="Dictyocha speculum, Strain CCMP1381" /LENGTH=249 /DNA_ID=CAMNT_0028463291 /DNA_START=14 /DNA_END=763 /DNA_ORIENTATION=+